MGNRIFSLLRLVGSPAFPMQSGLSIWLLMCICVSRTWCEALLGSSPTSKQLQEEHEAGIRAFPGNSNPQDEELARLRKEIAEIRQVCEQSEKPSQANLE